MSSILHGVYLHWKVICCWREIKIWLGISFIFICQIWQFNLKSSVNLSKSLLLFESQFPDIGASLIVQMVKNPPAIWETWVQSLGQEDLLEKGMATHSSILAWRIPWTEESGKLQSTGLKRVRHDWVIDTLPNRDNEYVWGGADFESLLQLSHLIALSLSPSFPRVFWTLPSHLQRSQTLRS